MHPQAWMIGQLVGGTIGIWLFSTLAEWLIFQRMEDDPVSGKVKSVIAALMFAEGVYAFTSFGKPWYITGALSYMLGAVIVGFFKYRRGLMLRQRMAFEDTDLTETFQ